MFLNFQSLNGVRVNGTMIPAGLEHTLQHGDQVHIFRFKTLLEIRALFRKRVWFTFKVPFLNVSVGPMSLQYYFPRDIK